MWKATCLSFLLLDNCESVVRKEQNRGQGSIIVGAAGDLHVGNVLRSRKTKADGILQWQTETHAKSATPNVPVQEDTCLIDNNGIPSKELTQGSDRSWIEFCSNPVEESLGVLDHQVLNFANTADLLHEAGGQDDVSKMKIWSCSSSHLQSERIVQRMGPFQSTGNYSWHCFSLRSLGFSEIYLSKHPAGYNVLQFGFIGVNAEGKVVDQPPLHVHHGGLQSAGGSIYGDVVSCLLLGRRNDCAKLILAFAADDQCTLAMGGWACVNFKVPSGYCFFVKEPLSIYGYVNDVRMSDSPSLEWYLQWHVLLSPTESGKLRPLYTFWMFHPGVWDDLAKSRAQTASTFPTRLDRETFVWQSIAMPFSGTLVQGKYHSHGFNIDEVLVFAAMPSVLGLTAGNFSEKPVWEPINPAEVNAQSNAQVKQYIWDSFHSAVVRSRTDSVTSPALKCRFKRAIEVISGFDQYRKAETCCQQWVFKKGDVVTHVTFMSPWVLKLAHLPNETITMWPQHSHVRFFFETNDTTLSQSETPPVNYVVYGNHDFEDGIFMGGPYWKFGSIWWFDSLLMGYYKMFGNAAVPPSRNPFLIEVIQVCFMVALLILKTYWYYLMLVFAFLGFRFISYTSQEETKTCSRTTTHQ